MINLNALSADRFQQLAQVLLLEDYPSLQCLPTGQPDGGRDGLAEHVGTETSVASAVMQVKFRSEQKKTTFDWIVDAFTPEISKAAALKARGVQKYIVATNVHVSTHLDTGEFDRINSWFSSEFPLPVVAYWLEDFERRFERASVSLKLEFPSVLTGEHAVLLLMELDDNRDLARIRRAFIAMAADEFDKEARVRFQQIELDASLAEVYVELPFKYGAHHKSEMGTLYDGDVSEDYWASPAPGDGVAHHICVRSGSEARDVYLEGGPGQGKSTVTQFVAQVHRAKLLERSDFLDIISPSLKEAPFRFPIRIDLRRLADAVRQNDTTEGSLTLELFLARSVTATSGGQSVSVDDFVSFTRSVPTSLMFDGLDEVADLDLRSSLVDMITAGVVRLRANKADVQVLVTSRPSVLSSPVSLRTIDFALVRLTPLKALDVRRYAEKWVQARSLPQPQGADLLVLLMAKVTQEHVAELTRSPMQLAIFLSLLVTKGEALPELRTELYRDYVGLFMAREAVKNTVVRTHQRLIVQIVQYLAFVLQADAEANSGSGSIALGPLRTLIADYLRETGNEASLLDELFNFGLERVYVLTHRVEGLYEFEVQPLREYFAAEHLYSTAPIVSTRMDSAGGDTSQRFEALVYRPYWFNTMRFYGGFYTGGGVGALHASLLVLSSQSMALRILARSAGAALLSDWIFRIKRPVQSLMMPLVFDDLGIALSESAALVGLDPPSLVPQCGRDELRELIFAARFRDESSSSIDQRSVMFFLRNGGAFFDFRQWIDARADDRFGRLAIAKAVRRDANYLPDISAELDEAGVASHAQILLSAIDFMPSLARELNSEQLAQAIMEEGPTHAPIRMIDTAGAVNYLAGGPGQFHIRDGAAISEDLFEIANRMRYVGSTDSADEIDYRLEVLRSHFGDCVGLRTCALTAIVRGGTELQKLPPSLSDPVFDEFRRALSLLDSPDQWFEEFSVLGDVAKAGWILGVLCLSGARRLAIQGGLEEFLDQITEAAFRRIERAVYSGRRVRRRSPERFNFSLVKSERLASLMAVLASPREIETAIDKFPEESSVGVAARRRVARTWLASFQGWERGFDAECLEQLRAVGRRSRTDWSARPLSTRPLRDMPLPVSEEILREPSLYPREVLREAVSAVMSQHEVTTRSVLAVADEQEWELV